MTVDQEMIFTVNEFVKKQGNYCSVCAAEFYDFFNRTFSRKKGSVIPTDYCYNRTNKGIFFMKKPRLLKYLGDGMFECLGENYSYTGDVYTREKGSPVDVVVGTWKNGVFEKNGNWDLYRLK